MSLTTWRNPYVLAEGIHVNTGLDKNKVLEAISYFTAKRTDAEYFDLESTLYLPLFIEISNNYLLSPITGIFGNPFTGVRRHQEHSSSTVKSGLKMPREKWMISDFAALFMGTRYMTIDTPIVLKDKNQIVTDIDMAVWDSISNELAVLQLKWQDFDADDVRTQRSKAKNFVNQVDKWSSKLNSWITEYGINSLLKQLNINVKSVPKVYKFAIGRNASRFSSYGYSLQDNDISVGTWLQFLRLRLEIGSVENVVKSLMKD